VLDTSVFVHVCHFKDHDRYEYTCVEWRNFERENVQGKSDALLSERWELDGEQHVKSGMLVDMFWQNLRREKSS